MPRRPPRRLRIAAFGVGLLAVLGAVTPPATVEAASDRLPDLRAASIRDMRIVRSGSRRLLRFTGIMWNQGKGPLEIRASRKNRSSPWDVDQIVYDTAGKARRIETGASMRYAGDGHDHWHVRQMLTYHLWGGRGTLRDSKVGFCFFDTNLIDGSLPSSPTRAKYRESSCGKKNSLSTRNGISVGWGDKYPWNFAYQWIDITGLPAGTYTIRAAVDLYAHFDETRESNNCSWAKVRFGSSGRTVKVIDRGWSCVNDHSTSVYAKDVAWAREAGVSTGCGADMFCTYNTITRGQAATFLARLLDLPAATKDWFTDDERSTHESAINRLAEAGVVTGCTATKFCPDRKARRDEVASFVDGALDLPETNEDYYDDDSASRYEDEINRLAAANIAIRCGDHLVCPAASVTRGHMVRLLRRGFDTPEPPPDP